MVLPIEHSPLIGRGDEVERLQALLVGDQRLLTLWGTGGVGKTRVALRLAHQYQGAVCLCDLSEVTDEVSLLQAVARELDLAAGGGSAEALGQVLAGRDGLLLVLDNFEQLVAHAADSIGLWLRLAPQLRILITSRQRLRLSSEQTFELLPLSLPEHGSPIEHSPAAQLFIARARALNANFELRDTDTGDLEKLLSLVDGLPMAIELLAARTYLLDLSGLLKRIQASDGSTAAAQRLDVLSDSAPDRPRRHATLRNAFDWSWDLLNDTEQRALALCSVFRGTYSVEAAEAVLGSSALRDLQALRDRSLLQRPQPGRFATYQAVRSFASAKLEELGLQGDARLRHARWYVDFGRAEARLYVEGNGDLAGLALERVNLEAAFGWALADQRFELATDALLSLGPLLSARGPAAHHLALLQRLDSALPNMPEVLHALGKAQQALGSVEIAQVCFERALAAPPSERAEGTFRRDLGVLFHQQRRTQQARDCYERALETFLRIHDARLTATTIGNLGALDHDLGRYASARERYQEALTMLRTQGQERLQGIFLSNLAVLEQEQAHLAAAAECFEHALGLLRRQGERRGEAVVLGNLAMLRLEQDEAEAALGLLRKSMALAIQVGDLRTETLSRARLASALAQQGKPPEALSELAEAERCAAQLDDEITSEVVGLHRGIVEMSFGDREGALRQMRAARADRGARPPLVAISDDARTAMRRLEAQIVADGHQALELGPQASWFRRGSTERVDLRPHDASRRLLLRLADEHARRPGNGVSIEELFDAGWPGEKIAARSAHNRVHVALTRIRKGGLQELLQRSNSNYALDPNCLILRRPADPSADLESSSAGD